MQSHLTGPITGSRLGSIGITQSYPFDYSDATARTVGTVKASAANPVLVEGFLMIQTSMDGTTFTVEVSIGGTAHVAAFNVKGAANAVSAGTPLILTADSDIVLTPAITGTPTVGRVFFVLRAIELNVDRTSK